MSRFAGLPPERIGATIEEFRDEQLPELERQAGSKGVRASERVAARAREAAVESAQPAREPVVDRYEVVLQR